MHIYEPVAFAIKIENIELLKFLIFENMKDWNHCEHMMKLYECLYNDI